jgi:phage terminase small subunit
MGRRGPPRTPTPLLKLRGSWKAAERAHEPHAPRGRPRPPAWLDQAEREAFRRFLKRIDRLSLASIIDDEALALLAATWVD